MQRSIYIDIIGLTETWATADIFNSELDIPDFNLYRRDRNHTLKCKGEGLPSILGIIGSY